MNQRTVRSIADAHRAVAAATVAVLALCAAGASPSLHANAQAIEAPKLEIALFAPYLVVRDPSAGRPAVRVVGPDGTLKIAVRADGDRPADGRWTIALRTPAMDPSDVVTVDPDDVVTADVDGRATTVTVPRMTADVDVDADVVSGTVPPTLAVYVIAAKDAMLDGPQPAVQPVVTAALDGRYRAELGDRIDLAPGTSGYVAMLDAAQNLFAFAFAPPLITISPARYIAVVRANADARPEVAVVDALGTEIARSGPPITFGAGVFGIILLRGGRPENGAFQPQPGERVALLIGARTVAEATLPNVTATIDADARTVSGVAPAGARVVVTARPSADGSDAADRTDADGDGRYRVAFPSVPFADDAVAFAQAWSGGSVAYEVAGRVPQSEIELWGNVLRGYVDGRGELRVTHTPSDGRPIAQRVVNTEIDGRFEADVYDRDGQPALFAPGDRIALTPTDGAATEWTIPNVTATVADGGRVLAGDAPPGATITADIFADEPDYFGARQTPSPSVTRTGRADEAGRYALRCDGEGCPARYGRVTVRGAGRVRTVLRWVDQPFFGIGVTLATAFGRATGGTLVDATVASGPTAGEHRTAYARPSQPDQLPLWEIDLSDVFPGGIPVGTQLRLGIGAAATDIAIAPVTWHADVLADRVTGTAPPLHVIVLIVVPVDQDRDPTSVTVPSGPDGRFAADLGGFNLRAGDQLYLYVIQPGDNHFLQYIDDGVDGPEEPMPVATPTAGVPPPRPSPIEPPRATATSTPRASDRTPVYLPLTTR
ncbi:MAG: hypothetical protein ABI780_00580 [Ardenticatenales bacterium]